MPLFACSFEAGDKAFYEAMGWTFHSSCQVIDDSAGSEWPADSIHRSAQGHGGNYALWTDGVWNTPVFSQASRWLNFWMRPGDHSTPLFYLTFRYYLSANSTYYDQASLVFTPSGTILLLRGGWVGTAVAASTGPWNTESDNWISVEMYCGDEPIGGGTPTGYCRVYINGKKVLESRVAGMATTSLLTTSSSQTP